MLVWLALLGGDCAWAQDAPLPMPGVPPPTRPRAPLPPPVPLPPGATPVPLNPGGLSPEDIPIIDFVPAARPKLLANPYAFEYKDYQWREVQVGTHRSLQVVAVEPTSTTTIALGDAQGGVWISTDGLISIREALPPPGGGGLDRQGTGPTMDDILSNVDVDLIGDNGAYQSEEALNEAAQILEQAISEARDQANANATTQTDDNQTMEGPPHLMWVEDVLFVGRNDGLWRSADGGASFEQVLSALVYTVVSTESGFLAGTSEGIQHSSDGLSWSEQSEGAADVVVSAILPLNGVEALAATDHGLYHSADGVRWRLRAETDEPLVSMVLDPDIPGRIWFGTDNSVLQSDDMGASMTQPLSAPLSGVSQMRHLGPLHWLAATHEGVWETINGGLQWQPVVRDLSASDVTSLEVQGGRVFATAGGVLHELIKPSDAVHDPEERARLYQEEARRWIARGALIDSGMHRPELTAKQGKMWVAYALPRVTLNVLRRVSDGVKYNSGLTLTNPLLDDRAGTFRPFDNYSRVSIELRWTPPGRQQRTVGGADGAIAGADVGVGLALPSQGLGTSSHKSVAYQADVARWINELYSQRLDVISMRPETATQPLLQQVYAELAILELEANLDVYTNGAVSEWKRSMERSPPGGSP